MKKGLYFRKLDLHIHTPASNCFSNKDITPKEIVDAAISKGLDAIAITDHNTGEWIDKIKAEAQDTELIIFPGVEITVAEGIHIVGIFNIDKGSQDISSLLGLLNILPSQYAKSDTVCNLAASTVIDKIIEREGIAILAHIDSHKGAYNELEGITRLKLFNEANYSAVETKEWKLPTDLNKGKGFMKIPTYYQASDNLDPTNNIKHSLEGIGQIYTYFKMDNINLEGLRQSFGDSDVRIKPMNSSLNNKYPRIMKIKASDGFMKHQNIIFHPGLNSIIGGKGVGKSLIVELLRFGLGQSSENKEILEDHNSKIKKKLGTGNSVEIDIMLKSGTKYKIVRKVDGEHTCIEIDDNKSYEGNISELFPILAYSQTEVVKIAENEDAQLKLIDSFMNTNNYKQRIIETNDLLSLNSDALSKSINAEFELTSAFKDLNTTKEKLIEIDKSLNSDDEEEKILAQYKQLELKKTSIENKSEYINELEQVIFEFNKKVKDLQKVEVDKSLIDDEDLLLIDNKIMKLQETSLKYVNELIKDIKICREAIALNTTEFTKDFADSKEKYNLAFSKTEINKELKKNRDDLVEKSTELQKKYDLLTNLVNKSKELKDERNRLLDNLATLYLGNYMDRNEMYKKLTDSSNGKLKLELCHAKNPSSFKDELTNLLRGSSIRNTIIESICNSIQPREFVEIIITKNSNELKEKGDIDINNATKIIEKLWSGEDLIPTLELQHLYYPEDAPTIKFRKSNDEYSPLDELSVGQKCTALLIIALSEGDRPVIIDQPEDALDITTVWEDVSLSLRSNKENRQFILTTHNSSVAVASDSDNFIMVNSNSTIANVKCKGGIDGTEVKKDVIKCLEGGEIPYLLRGSKYNIKNT